MPEVGDFVRRLMDMLRSLPTRHALRALPALPDLLLACVLLALLLSLVLPWVALIATRPAEAGAVNAFLDACQRGARRGPLAIAGYGAGAVVFTWAAVSILRLVWRLVREVHALRRASAMLRAAAYDVEVCVGGRMLEVRVLDVPGRVAFASGLLRPRIFASRSLFAELATDELAAVLEHEAEHVRQRHPLKCWLVDILCATTWWPGLQAVTAHFRAQREATADAAAVVKLGDAAPLLRAIQRTEPVPAGLAVCGIAHRTGSAIQQVRLDGQRLSRDQLMRFAGGLMLVVGLLGLAVAGLGDWQLYWSCPQGTGTVS